MICQFCKADDEHVRKIPVGEVNGSPRFFQAHETCFIDWAKATLKVLEERDNPDYWVKFLDEINDMHKADQALANPEEK